MRRAIDWPERPTPDLVSILGRPNFRCANIATGLRSMGWEIPHHAEEEQASVILWCLTLYFDHGRDWLAEANRIMTEVQARRMAETLVQARGAEKRPT